MPDSTYYYGNAVRNAANNSTVPRRNLTTMGNQALGRVDALTPQVDQSLQSLIGLLSKRGGDQDRANLINSRKGALTSNYLNARSRIQSGFGGRLPNSMEAGQLANLEGANATALSGLYNDADDQMRGDEMGNANALLQVLSGARSGARGEYLQGVGIQQGIDQTNIGNFSNLAQQEEEIKRRKAAEQQQWLQSILGVAQLAGGWTGGGSGGGAGGAVMPPGTGWNQGGSTNTGWG